MPRRKSAPQAAPSTLSEAIAIIERYLCLLGLEADAAADADKAIQSIQTARDELVAPIRAEANSLFLQLRAWWAVAGGELTGGKAKSAELAGAIIGERTTPPSLRLPRGMKVEDAVGYVKSLIEQFPGTEYLVRVKHELEKPAIIKLLRSNTAVGPVIDCMREQGFAVVQREEFFIDRAAPKEAEPQLVDAPQPEIAEARS